MVGIGVILSCWQKVEQEIDDQWWFEEVGAQIPPVKLAGMAKMESKYDDGKSGMP